MKNKKIVIGIGILFILSVFTVIVFLYINAEKITNTIIHEQIIDTYNASNNTKYLIRYDGIKFHFLSGSIDIQNLSIVPKKSLIALQSRVDNKPTESAYIYISIDKVSLQEFDYLLAFSSRIFKMKKFEINHPVINIFTYDNQPDSIMDKQDTINLREILLVYYDTFLLDEILIRDASAHYFQVTAKNDTTNVFSINNLSWQLTKLQADKRTLYNPPYFTYQAYKLHSKNIEAAWHNKATFSARTLHFESSNNVLEMLDVEFNPLLKSSNFFKKNTFRKAWVHFTFKQLIAKVDLHNWLVNDELYIYQFNLLNPRLTIVTNTNKPFEPGLEKPMLGTMLTSIPIPYHVKSIWIKDAQIDLEIIGRKNPESGFVRFNNMQIEGSNLTNISSKQDSNKYFVLQGNTQINGTGNVDVNLNINLKDPESKTDFLVEAQNLELIKFNTILEPITRIGITSGKLRYLKIQSTLSINGATGTTDAYYTNLKLQLKAKDWNKETGLLGKVASKLANGVLKNNNIPGSKNYHQGKFSFKKLQNDSFFKMLWLTALHGLSDSVLGSDRHDHRKARKEQRKQRKKQTN